MHRVDTSGHVSNLFSNGDPSIPRLPTQVDAAILNAFQEELANAILTAGVALVKGTNNQLASVMANLNTAQSFTAKKTFSAGLAANAVSGDPAVLATGGTGPGEYAVKAIGAGTNAAVRAEGNGGAGVDAKNGAGTTSTVETINVINGYQRFRGTNPAANTVFPANVVQPSNIVKAWALIQLNVGSGPTLLNGHNIDTVALSTTTGISGGTYSVTGVRVALKNGLTAANAMAATASCLSRGSTGYQALPADNDATQLDVLVYNPNGTTLAANSVNAYMAVIICGLQ